MSAPECDQCTSAVEVRCPSGLSGGEKQLTPVSQTAGSIRALLSDPFSISLSAVAETRRGRKDVQPVVGGEPGARETGWLNCVIVCRKGSSVSWCKSEDGGQWQYIVLLINNHRFS